MKSGEIITKSPEETQKFAEDLARELLEEEWDGARVIGPEDLTTLGLDEILANPLNLVLIEWAERVAEILPAKHITIHLDHISESERKIATTQF